MSLVEVTWATVPDPRGDGAAVLAAAVAGFCGLRTDEVRLTHACRHCGSARHGRPVVVPTADLPRPPEVSLSRADDGVLVAVGDAGPVGVDVERVNAPGWAALDPVLLHPAEHAPDAYALAVTWVRKESLLKATGHGLSVAPDTVRLTNPGLPPGLLSWAGPDAPTTTWLYDVPMGPQHVACLTVLSLRAPRVEVRREAPAAASRSARPGTAPRADTRSRARRTR